jgi:hypothetical protein
MKAPVAAHGDGHDAGPAEPIAQHLAQADAANERKHHHHPAVPSVAVEHAQHANHDHHRGGDEGHLGQPIQEQVGMVQEVHVGEGIAHDLRGAGVLGDRIVLRKHDGEACHRWSPLPDQESA